MTEKMPVLMRAQLTCVGVMLAGRPGRLRPPPFLWFSLASRPFCQLPCPPRWPCQRGHGRGYGLQKVGSHLPGDTGTTPLSCRSGRSASSHSFYSDL